MWNKQGFPSQKRKKDHIRNDWRTHYCWLFFIFKEQFGMCGWTWPGGEFLSFSPVVVCRAAWGSFANWPSQAKFLKSLRTQKYQNLIGPTVLGMEHWHCHVLVSDIVFIILFINQGQLIFFFRKDHLTPEPCQWLHKKSITCTSLCIKEQFGNLGAEELFLAAFITSCLRWPSTHSDFSAAELPGTLMSENKCERGKTLFVPKKQMHRQRRPMPGHVGEQQKALPHPKGWCLSTTLPLF